MTTSLKKKKTAVLNKNILLEKFNIGHLCHKPSGLFCRPSDLPCWTVRSAAEGRLPVPD